MKRHVVALIWNTFIHFIAVSFLLWGILYGAFFGIDGFIVALIFAGITLVFIFTFTFEARTKVNSHRVVDKSNIDGVCFIYLLGLFAASYYMIQQAGDFVVSNSTTWDTMFQSLPYGIGVAFTSMAYESVGELTGAKIAAESFHGHLWLTVVSVLVALLTSFMFSLPLTFKTVEDCYAEGKRRN